MTVQGINVEINNTIKESVAARKEQFNMLMDNANPVNRDSEGKVVLSSCTIPLNMLKINYKYQRNHRRINKLIEKWDPRKLMPIVVVPDAKNGVFYIVDGGGRYEVAPKKGLTKLSALVIMDAPTNAKERLKFEAGFFSTQNDEVEKLRKVDKHNAMILAGDKAAMAVEEICEKYKVQIASGMGQRKMGVLGSYAETYSFAKAHGKDCLDFIFGIIENAGWSHETNGYNTYVLRALKTLFVAHTENRKEIFDYLSNELRNINPTLFSADAKSKYPKREGKMACILHIEDVVCENLKLEKMVFIENERIAIRKGA